MIIFDFLGFCNPGDEEKDEINFKKDFINFPVAPEMAIATGQGWSPCCIVKMRHFVGF
jgi:hypothetical protein